MWTDAYAQAATGGMPAANPMLGMALNVVPYALVFVILYVFLIQPQQKRQKDLDRMLKALKKGDRVLTSGGMFGTVVGVEDAKVVLRVADDVKLEFSKPSIVQVIVDEKLAAKS